MACVKNGKSFSFDCKVPIEPSLCEGLDHPGCLTKVIDGPSYDCPQFICTPAEVLITTSTVQVIEVRNYENYYVLDQGKISFIFF